MEDNHFLEDNLCNPEQPKGVQFFDGRSQRSMLLVQHPGHPFDGWIFYEGKPGHWTSLRKADGLDFLAIHQARREKIMNPKEPMKRTPDEILTRIEKIAASVMSAAEETHGVERSRLMNALPWSYAQKYLKPDAPHTEETWEIQRCNSREAVISTIRGYLEHAWGRANLSMGMSAQKSVAYFRGLIWLLGPECDHLVEALADPEDFNHEFYGKASLVKVSELVGHDWKKIDNDKWKDIYDDSGRKSMTAQEAFEFLEREPEEEGEEDEDEDYNDDEDYPDTYRKPQGEGGDDDELDDDEEP